ncbi:uncharacterized protein PHACADRAFT_33532 [Phanerochaete carnosa HHB-10118-sp]|uniref:Uncharacterized protein n=1 Tax=Phanerochaete carnosa (strain HHB-10118-sp) TaxID=650164 RepID=K5UIJ5_PHACS|nr:uncharacterized protein PHACADRAFT_33532 [Phanerochaete carnosa HHB-10118-sp]EKM49316.1 hypothetical protein PHACADRAFT_33532 [Phanerochaete carnosa HHB-10118-sp]
MQGPVESSSKENLLEEQSTPDSEREFEELPRLPSETREAYQQCKRTYICWLKQQKDNGLEIPKPAKNRQSSEHPEDSHVQEDVLSHHSKSPNIRFREAKLLHGNEALEPEEAQSYVSEAQYGRFLKYDMYQRYANAAGPSQRDSSEEDNSDSQSPQQTNQAHSSMNNAPTGAQGPPFHPRAHFMMFHGGYLNVGT